MMTCFEKQHIFIEFQLWATQRAVLEHLVLIQKWDIMYCWYVNILHVGHIIREEMRV